LENLKDAYAAVTSRIENQARAQRQAADAAAAAFGPTAASSILAYAKAIGITEARLGSAKDMLDAMGESYMSMAERAQQTVEQFMDPLERFTREKTRLEREFAMGFYGEGTRALDIHNRALKDAREQLEGIKDKTVDLRFLINGRDAAAAGSLEALARADEYMERMRGVQTVGVRPDRRPAPSPMPITAPVGPQVWGTVTGTGGKVEGLLTRIAKAVESQRRQTRVRKALDVRPSKLGGTLTPGGAP
jgi:hypothetical protein